MGRPALVQAEERAEKQRFPSLQRRMSAEDEGRTTLPRVLLALPGERLRDPDTSSSLLLYYSPSCLFVGFLHLTACLIPVIGGLLPLPARPPEPNSLSGLIYEQRGSRNAPCSSFLSSSGTGSWGRWRKSSRNRDGSVTAAKNWPGPGQSQPLPCTEASQQHPAAPGSAWDAAALGEAQKEDQKLGCSLKVFPELGKGQPFRSQQGTPLLGTVAASDSRVQAG